MTEKQWLVVMTVLAAVALVACSLQKEISAHFGLPTGKFREFARADVTFDPSLSGAAQGPAPKWIQPAMQSNLSEQVKWVIEKRLEHYRGLSEAISLNLKMVGLVVLLAFWALRAPDTDIKLPLAVEGVHLPKPIALTALALGGLYFHLQFGFTLNAAITDRLSLETMWKAFAEDGIKWWPPHGGAALLDSQNLLDVWFTANEGYLEGSFMPSGLKGFAIAAEILVGAIYGVVDAVVVVMAVRTVTICSDPKIRFGAAALAGVMIALLAVSQFIFAFGGGHPNHFQFATMLALVGGAWFVHWALKPKTKAAGVPASPPAGAALAI